MKKGFVNKDVPDIYAAAAGTYLRVVMQRGHALNVKAVDTTEAPVPGIQIYINPDPIH